MKIIHNKYYIVRAGDFATDGNTKLLYCIISSLLCIEEYITQHKTDCLIIMTGSTLVWSFIELLLHKSKTRNIKAMNVNITGKKQKMPTYLGICLQGFQEGGFVTATGLYFGDRMYIFKYFVMLHALLLFIIINIGIKTNHKISSKRQVNSIGSVALMGYTTLYNLKSIYYNPQHIQRQFYMFCTMIYISSIWTFCAWYKRFRQVEIQQKNENGIYQARSITNTDVLLVLGYDIIFEIGIAYLTFYNLFIL